MFQQASQRASKRATAAIATGIASVITWEHHHHHHHHDPQADANAEEGENGGAGGGGEQQDVDGDRRLLLSVYYRDPLHLQSPYHHQYSRFPLLPTSTLNSSSSSMNVAQCDAATSQPSSSLFSKGLSSILRRMHQSETKDTSLESIYKIKSKTPIGEGAFGQVFLGSHKQTGEQVAIKKIWKEFTNRQDCQREMSALLHIKEHGGHPHICSLHENFDEAQHYALILDLINGGELFDRLVENGAYSELDASRLMREVVSAINFLHGIGLVHGDLKPENLMLSQTHRSSIIKVVDFGCSELVDLPLPPSTQERNSTGTVAYYSPERGLDTKQAPTKALDMWALGIILFIMLTGLHPLDPEGNSTDEQLKAKLRRLYDKKINLMESRKLKPFISHLSPSAIQLLTLLLEPDPTKRVEASKLIQHPWIRGLTATEGKIENSDKRLSKIRKFRSKIETKVFQQLVSFADAGHTKTKGSLFQKAFSSMDKEDKGFLTVDDVSGAALSGLVGPPPADGVPADDMSLSEFSTLLGDNMVSKYLPTGHVLYREGDIGHHMYFINSGKIDVSTKDGFRAVLQHGDTCGEGGLLNENRQRSATLRTMTPVHVIQIDREHFLKYLIGSDSELGIKMREKINARKFGRAEYILANHAKNEETKVPKNHIVFTDGDEVSGFHLLCEGMIDVMTKKGKRLYDVKPGEVFGIQSFLMEKNNRRDLAKCIADEGCTIKTMHRDTAHDLFQKNPGIKESLSELALRREFRRAIVLKFNKSFPRDKQGLRKVFDAIDLDKSGLLKKEELKELLLTHLDDLILTEDDVEALLATMDLQQNGVVDFEEFCSIFLGKHLL
ncbi:unnamed protein product [Cylindrotheca closterium]|uniref:cGMP-dependent protein kinase n=1 Tax=Cylindrotheca closterium TaxID=2856 RepID=A0AAD2JL78_9STRA|nr:unnamed protein product [Cylindrotheca closterium]